MQDIGIYNDVGSPCNCVGFIGIYHAWLTSSEMQLSVCRKDLGLFKLNAYANFLTSVSANWTFACLFERLLDFVLISKENRQLCLFPFQIATLKKVNNQTCKTHIWFLVNNWWNEVCKTAQIPSKIYHPVQLLSWLKVS